MGVLGFQIAPYRLAASGGDDSCLVGEYDGLWPSSEQATVSNMLKVAQTDLNKRRHA